MPNPLPPLFCPNLKCRKSNTEHDQFCQQCGTPLPKRYLWVIGPNQEGYQPGDRLGERYVFRGPHIVLDTQPGYPVRINADVPDLLLPYLKLFPYRLHLPQLYTLVHLDKEGTSPVALLEQAPLSAADLFPVDIAVENPSPPIQVGSSQTLLSVWPQTHVLRQINWLWQISQLWQPLASQGVVSTLLDPGLVRVEGRLVRLLELKLDRDHLPTMADLGQLWEQWVPQTQGSFADEFARICRELTSGSITAPEVLQVQLERALSHYQAGYQVRIDISARTDPGPLRDHNEDACYPNHGVVAQNSDERLAVVCDGVGGHDGGEVASEIAIEAMTAHLTAVQKETLPVAAVTEALEAATFKANDLISARNDEEQRQDRQRMGTTLVTALVHQDQLYITHIGDSRAYLITNNGCYQVTVDDDIASREVRLGYVPYREALQQPAAGSLIQALGMASSSVLRPTVQRFILDEDCVLLLCSDGLSDYDRVEHLWQSEIQPLLYDETDLVTVTKNLIDQANRLNGHDNVTVAILNCRVTRQRLAPRTMTPPAAQATEAAATVQPATQIPEEAASPTVQDSPPVMNVPFPWRSLFVAGGLLLLAMGSLAVIFFTRQPQQPSSSPSSTPTQPAVSPKGATEDDDPASQDAGEGAGSVPPELESAPESGTDIPQDGAADNSTPKPSPTSEVLDAPIPGSESTAPAVTPEAEPTGSASPSTRRSNN